MRLTEFFLPVAALLFVTGLFLVLATVVNRLRRGGPWLAQPRGVGGAGAPGRVEVALSCALDARRRLVLVRCGVGEALLLVGGPNDLVVMSRDSLAPLPSPFPEEAL